MAGGQIIFCHEAAARLKRRDNIAGNLARVEGICAAFGNLLQRTGKMRIFQDRAGPGRFALDQVSRCGNLVAAQFLNILCPVPRDTRRNRKAFAGIADRPFEQILERPRSMGLQKRFPCPNGTGHSDRMRRRVGDLFNAEFSQPLRGRSPRCRAGSVEACQAPVRLGDNCKTVTADACHVRLDHTLHGYGRNRGVHRVAAFLQDLKCRAGRQGVRRRRCCIARINRGPARRLKVTLH